MSTRPQAARSAARRLVAHRGYPLRYPENSLVGMHAVLDAGARGGEFDVQVSRDGHAVAAHDDDILRVSGENGRVTQMDLAALTATAAGEPARFGDAFAEVRFSPAADMLDLIGQYRGVHAFVDLKDETVAAFGREAAVDAVLRALAPTDVAWTLLCGDARALALGRAHGAPSIGWVFEAWTRTARRQVERLRPEYLFTPAARVPAARAPFWPGTGWRWCVYDVNDAATAVDLFARGADLVETDCLPELARALGDGAGSRPA